MLKLFAVFKEALFLLTLLIVAVQNVPIALSKSNSDRFLSSSVTFFLVFGVVILDRLDRIEKKVNARD